MPHYDFDVITGDSAPEPTAASHRLQDEPAEPAPQVPATPEPERARHA